MKLEIGGISWLSIKSGFEVGNIGRFEMKECSRL